MRCKVYRGVGCWIDGKLGRRLTVSVAGSGKDRPRRLASNPRWAPGIPTTRTRQGIGTAWELRNSAKSGRTRAKTETLRRRRWAFQRTVP